MIRVNLTFLTAGVLLLASSLALGSTFIGTLDFCAGGLFVWLSLDYFPPNKTVKV